MAWIFQAVPKRYDLRTELRANETETWLVTRYGQRMRRGDVVYFWLGGEGSIRGLYGWGQLLSSQTDYYSDWGDGINVRCKYVFPQHLPADVIEASPAMSEHLLFKMPIGTNFALTDTQDRELKALILDRYGRSAVPK